MHIPYYVYIHIYVCFISYIPLIQWGYCTCVGMLRSLLNETHESMATRCCISELKIIFKNKHGLHSFKQTHQNDMRYFINDLQMAICSSTISTFVSPLSPIFHSFKNIPFPRIFVAAQGTNAERQRGATSSTSTTTLGSSSITDHALLLEDVKRLGEFNFWLNCFFRDWGVRCWFWNIFQVFVRRRFLFGPQIPWDRSWDSFNISRIDTVSIVILHLPTWISLNYPIAFFLHLSKCSHITHILMSCNALTTIDSALHQRLTKGPPDTVSSLNTVDFIFKGFGFGMILL